MTEAFISRLREDLPADIIKLREKMSLHTSFRIGGEAGVFVTPRSEAELAAAVSAAKASGLEYIIAGNGSNLLVSDEGTDIVICTLGLRGISLENEYTVTACAGNSLAEIAAFCLNHSLTGFEFASGIPGTFGGAVYMNAGAYGGEMREIVSGARLLSESGEAITLNNSELRFGYRKSLLQEEPYFLLFASLELKPGRNEEIRQKMFELNARRLEKQPLEYPSGGSTFKRPDGYFAGKLIMDAGLAGFQIGGARVSEKHCGFIINTGSATADDVYRLIQHIKETVFDKFGVELEPELRFVGKFKGALCKQ